MEVSGEVFVRLPLQLCIAAALSALACGNAIAQQPVQQPVQQAPGMQRSGYIQQMDTEFRRRDADGDGRITRAEMTTFELDLAIATARTQNAELFTRLDTDRNGTISQVEFAALVGGVQTPDVTPLMQRFDGNRDQAVTLVEYRAATLANFDRLDTDLDGVVTQAEITAGNQTRPQTQAPPAPRPQPVGR